MSVLGVVSDTHGLVRPELLAALEGCAAIVHAGDVGGARVLDALRAVAPLTVVRGNNDAPSSGLGEREVLTFAGFRLHVLHDLAQLDLDPAAEGVHAVIHGHSHRPRIETRDGVLFLNPGSAGPRRFRLPVSIARVRVREGRLEAELVELLPT